MNIGSIVAVVSERGFERFGTIVATGVLSHFTHGQRCFRIGEDGSMFYMEPDPRTGRLFKVEDTNFWIENPPVTPHIGNSGDCIIVHDGFGKPINVLHKIQGYGYLQDTQILVDVLEVGYAQDIEESEIQALRDNVANGADGDWNAFFSKLLLKKQETYHLACWLDN